MSTHRWNVEETDDGFRICRGEHEKAHECEWEYFAPRTLLAAPPEVTREAPTHDELKHEMWEEFRNCSGTFGDIASACANVALRHIAALSHFAPPPAPPPISGMSVDELQAIAQKAEDDFGHGNVVPRAAMEEIYRLAQPAQVDPDAKAKRLAWEYYKVTCPSMTIDEAWKWAGPDQKRWRAVAAAKERGE